MVFICHMLGCRAGLSDRTVGVRSWLGQQSEIDALKTSTCDKKLIRESRNIKVN